MRSTIISLVVAAFVLISIGLISTEVLQRTMEGDDPNAKLGAYIFAIIGSLMSVAGCVLAVVALIIGVVKAVRSPARPKSPSPEQLNSSKTGD